MIVEGLDSEVSWQDLKDFGRTVASSVSFADVYREKGEGVIEYRDYEVSIYLNSLCEISLKCLDF